MAKVRQCVGRGVNEFVLKLFNYNSLYSQSKVWNNLTHPSLLSLNDIKNCGRNGAENAAKVKQEMAGVYPSRVKQRLHSGLEKDKYTEDYCCRPDENQYSSKNRLQMTKHRNHTNTWRNLSNPVGGQRTPCFRHFFRGCEQFVFIREYSGDGTRSEPLYKTKTGYYDVLGLSPSATQAQIKTAYYKQSFIYHPDRNAGSDEATVRFSVISEAYTVLGNRGLRKKYDRGLLSLSDFAATTKHASAKQRDATGASATHQAANRRSAAGTDRQDGLYFDTFYRNHYDTQLEKERRRRALREMQQKAKEETFEDKKMEVEVEFGMLLMVLVGCWILSTIK